MTRARGFTLVESLIGLVVLSVGLLGAAAMLLDSLRTHAGALQRVVAISLAHDMAERIRANPRARPAYDTRYAASGHAACDALAGCDAEQLAAADLARFLAAAHALLPRADTVARVEFAPAIGAAEPDRYVITLRWRDVRSGDDSDDEVALQVLAVAPVAG
jgi:type IV pilus assembly protein PilV